MCTGTVIIGYRSVTTIVVFLSGDLGPNFALVPSTTSSFATYLAVFVYFFILWNVLDPFLSVIFNMSLIITYNIGATFHFLNICLLSFMSHEVDMQSSSWSAFLQLEFFLNPFVWVKVLRPNNNIDLFKILYSLIRVLCWTNVDLKVLFMKRITLINVDVFLLYFFFIFTW